MKKGLVALFALLMFASASFAQGCYGTAPAAVAKPAGCIGSTPAAVLLGNCSGSRGGCAGSRGGCSGVVAVPVVAVPVQTAGGCTGSTVVVVARQGLLARAHERKLARIEARRTVAVVAVVAVAAAPATPPLPCPPQAPMTVPK